MATISSAAAPPAIVIAKRAAAIAPPTRPRPYSDRNITPACAVPDDLLAAGKEQLDSPRRRAGALYRASRSQLLRFPPVDQRKPNPAGTHAVFLQRDRVIEKLAHKAHVSIPLLALTGELGDGFVGAPALRPILADLFEQWDVGHSIKDGIGVTFVTVTPPRKTRYDENVVGPPIKPLPADLRSAFAFDRHVKGTSRLSLEPGRLARAEQLRSVIQCRKQRGAGGGVDEPQRNRFVGISLFPAQPIEHLQDIGAAVMEHRRHRAPKAALVPGKARQHATLSIKLAGVTGVVADPLRPGIARGFAGELVVEPDAIEKLHQRKIQHIDPRHRLASVIAVIVPSAVRGKDQIAARRLTALPLDRRVAALFRQDRAARVGGVDVHRSDIARIVDRHRAAHRAGDLKTPAEPRIS